jgi:hypothetical protein
MLENHQRAALIPNEPNLMWHHFLRSRFVSQQAPGLALVVLGVVQQSGSHAELAGLVEYGSGATLPVVVDFAGTLDLDTREFSIRESQPERDAKSYVGRFSENGRVIVLRSAVPDGRMSKPFHLVHDETLAELDAG